MGRRRRKIIKKKVARPPPKIFMCPICNVEAVTVRRAKDEEYADVVCSNCKASVKVRWRPSYSEVDAYTEFYDVVTGARKIAAVHEASGGESHAETSIEGGRETDEPYPEMKHEAES